MARGQRLMNLFIPEKKNTQLKFPMQLAGIFVFCQEKIKPGPAFRPEYTIYPLVVLASIPFA